MKTIKFYNKANEDFKSPGDPDWNVVGHIEINDDNEWSVHFYMFSPAEGYKARPDEGQQLPEIQ